MVFGACSVMVKVRLRVPVVHYVNEGPHKYRSTSMCVYPAEVVLLV